MGECGPQSIQVVIKGARRSPARTQEPGERLSSRCCESGMVLCQIMTPFEFTVITMNYLGKAETDLAEQLTTSNSFSTLKTAKS